MHAKLNRTILRWSLLALALGGFQIAHAARTTVGSGAATNWVATRSGSNVTVSLQASGGVPNVATSKALNAGSAWQQLSNNPNAYASRIGVGLSSAGDPTFEALLRQPMGGAARAAELRAVSAIEKVSFGKALGLIALRANPYAAAFLTVASVVSELGFTLKPGANGEQNQITQVNTGGTWVFGPHTYCYGQYAVTRTIYGTSVNGIASQAAGIANSTVSPGPDGSPQGGCGGGSYHVCSASETTGAFTFCSDAVQVTGGDGGTATRVQSNEERLVPSDEFEAAARARAWPADSKIADAVAEAINSGATIDAEDPNLSGPNVVVGPEETTTNTDGSVSKSTTTWNCTYSLGPTEVCQPTGTTTITTKPDGSTSTTTTTPTSPTGTTTTTTGTTTTTTGTTTTTTGTTTTVPGTGTTSDLCKDHPDVLACSKPELDTPSGTIPKADRALTYSAESLGLSGTCPADKTITLHGGKVIKAWDWAASCSYITTYIKPFVILIAGFISLMIILPARTET